MEEELNVQHSTFNVELKKLGSTPIKLIENGSRTARRRRTGVYRITATGIIIAAGCCCGKHVFPAIKHGQDGRGTIYLIFRNIDGGLCRNMPEAIKR